MSAELQASIQNEAEFRKRQAELANMITGGNAVLAGFRKAVMMVMTEAKRNAPVDTGRLRSSITGTVTSSKGGNTSAFGGKKSVINGIVGTNVKYAPYMEFGTGTFAGNKPHFPPPHALDVWAKRHGFSSGYQVAYAIFLKGGLEPRKFFQDAVKNKQNQVKSIIEDAYKRQFS